MSKKRVNGEGTIRKRKNGTWECRITVSLDPQTGKQLQKSLYGKTQKEVKAKLEEFLAAKEEAASFNTTNSQTVSESDGDDLTLSEWLDIWLADYLSDIKIGTLVSYQSLVNNHIRKELGKYKLKNLKPPVIQKFYNKLRGQGLSPKYIKNIHGCLHRTLDMAVKVEYIEKNYTSVCSIPKVTAQEVVPLTEEEQKRLFEAMKGEEYEFLFLTDIFTGMRCGEVIGLTWDCVDFDKGIITIKRQLVQTRTRGAKYIWGTLKNGKTRIIAPAPFVMDVLKKQQAKQAEMKATAGKLWNEGDFPNLVFTHRDGSHLSQPTVWKQFQKLLEKAGLEHHRVHDLRHTFAVNSLRAGDDIKTLQENMGHYSAAFTLDRYGHVTEEMRKASSQRMQAFIDGMTGGSNENQTGDNTDAAT